jgi:hypothetical protein
MLERWVLDLPRSFSMTVMATAQTVTHRGDWLEALHFYEVYIPCRWHRSVLLMRTRLLRGRILSARLGCSFSILKSPSRRRTSEPYTVKIAYGDHTFENVRWWRYLRTGTRYRHDQYFMAFSFGVTVDISHICPAAGLNTWWIYFPKTHRCKTNPWPLGSALLRCLDNGSPGTPFDGNNGQCLNKMTVDCVEHDYRFLIADGTVEVAPGKQRRDCGRKWIPMALL